jgi:2-polyprenyl-3-methyl-5-hydroxy-6-metoxy-1,4-benzoquinol methylase
MDQPDLDRQVHVHALSALARINFWSASARTLWREIARLRRKSGTASLTLLDIATGGGDVPIRLWRKARQAGFDLRVEGCDTSPTAIACAAQRAKEQEVEARFFVLDALVEALPQQYDVVTCSLFLHHLDDPVAVEFLRHMAAAATRMVLVSDLVRSKAGYALAYLGTRLLSRSRVTHIDGPLSVQSAFTPGEALELARQAGMAKAEVSRCWPLRYLLKWPRE